MLEEGFVYKKVDKVSFTFKGNHDLDILWVDIEHDNGDLLGKIEYCKDTNKAVYRVLKSDNYSVGYLESVTEVMQLLETEPELTTYVFDCCLDTGFGVHTEEFEAIAFSQEEGAKLALEYAQDMTSNYIESYVKYRGEK